MKNKKSTIEILHPITVPDSLNVVGMGGAKLQGQWIRARFRVEHLVRVIKALEILELEKVDLIYSKNNPLILGKLDEKKNTASGIMLAPIVERE